MSTTNYNGSVIGVPYVRVNNIDISYPENGIPTITLSQETAVLLADGTTAALGTMQTLIFSVDMVNNATIPIAEVDPVSGASLGTNTTLQQVLIAILAVIRQQQLISNP